MTPTTFYTVGGCVRDDLLGIPSKDVDFAVEAPSFTAMLDAIEARGARIFTITAEFLTVRAKDPVHGPADFVLCRSDSPYGDGRRPDHVTPGTIYDDLARRDFTVNAMARDERGELLDPHGGLDDLDARRLRFVGDPATRLREDALRALRGVRFEITKGFQLDADARAAIDAMTLADFAAVSTERIRDELLRCFAHDTYATLGLWVAEFGILAELAKSRGIWLRPTTEKVKGGHG